MKSIKAIVLFICITAFSQANAQKSQKEIDREKNKVEIFSDEEKANLQLHFYDKTKAMNLSEEVEEDYYRLVLHYIYDMRRLNDKDNNNSDEEVKQGLKTLTETMNSKIKPILSKDDYQTHLNNFNDLLDSVYRKNGWIRAEN